MKRKFSYSMKRDELPPSDDGTPNLEIYWHLHAASTLGALSHMGLMGFGALWLLAAAGFCDGAGIYAAPDGSLRGPDRGLPLSGGCVFPSGCLWHSGKDAGASVRRHRPHRSGVSDRRETGDVMNIAVSGH